MFKPNLIGLLCHATQGTIRPSNSLFPSLVKVLRLTPLTEVWIHTRDFAKCNFRDLSCFSTFKTGRRVACSIELRSFFFDIWIVYLHFTVCSDRVCAGTEPVSGPRGPETRWDLIIILILINVLSNAIAIALVCVDVRSQTSSRMRDIRSKK